MSRRACTQAQGLLQALGPISGLYDSMHELPVVQKRRRCAEMAALREGLLAQKLLREAVTLLATLRHHLHALTGRLLLLADSTSEGVPLDLLLGCLCSDLLALLKTCLPPVRARAAARGGTGGPCSRAARPHHRLTRGVCAALRAPPAPPAQGVLETFETLLPHARLALLVFVEFTT